MKDVVSCDKLRGAAYKRYILRFPNGTTWYVEDVSLEREPTRGTDTSKYPVEKKIKMIPLVVASEEGKAQTGGVSAQPGL